MQNAIEETVHNLIHFAIWIKSDGTYHEPPEVTINRVTAALSTIHVGDMPYDVLTELEAIVRMHKVYEERRQQEESPERWQPSVDAVLTACVGLMLLAYADLQTLHYVHGTLKGRAKALSPVISDIEECKKRRPGRPTLESVRYFKRSSESETVRSELLDAGVSVVCWVKDERDPDAGVHVLQPIFGQFRGAPSGGTRSEPPSGHRSDTELMVSCRRWRFPGPPEGTCRCAVNHSGCLGRRSVRAVSVQTRGWKAARSGPPK